MKHEALVVDISHLTTIKFVKKQFKLKKIKILLFMKAVTKIYLKLRYYLKLWRLN